MALTTVRAQLAAKSGRGVSLAGRLPVVRPTRLLLAALTGAFVMAMIYVLQIQSLVRLGAVAGDLESQLRDELSRGAVLRVEMERANNLAAIERRALFDLGLVANEEPNLVPAPAPEPRIDLSSPPWHAAEPPLRPGWWHRLLTYLERRLDQSQPPPSSTARQ